MGNTPIGNGPTLSHIGMGRLRGGTHSSALQFCAKDKGSTTTELLRGKLGKLRLAISSSKTQNLGPNFRELLSPKPLTQRLVELLQKQV